MHSRLLRSFLVVAEQGNISRAATVLHVSQPALTKSIRQLEQEYEVELFERTPKGVHLTKFGEVLLQHVKIMDNEHQHAVSRINELRHGRGASALKIGAGPVWLVSLLPPVISQYQAANPNISISLIGGVIDTLLPDLINGDLDLICVSLDFPNRSEITKRPLMDTHHVLVADPKHPLADNKDADAHSIHCYPWMVLKSDYVGTQRISSFFSANGLEPPRIAFETTSIHSLLQGLRGRDAIAHIPVQMLSLARQIGLREISLRQPIWETTAGYAYRTNAHITEPLRLLMNMLDAEATKS